jgi:hypothetical protein
MDLNTYKAIVEYIPYSRKTPIPFKNKKYAPLIEINGNKIFSGSARSVICYIYEAIDTNTYYAYIKFLNGEKAPNILHEGLNFYICEGPKRVASCKLIEISKSSINI